MGNDLKGLTFFRSYYEVARELPEKQRLALYDAIMQFAFDDEEPCLTGLANSFFTLIRPSVSKSKARAHSGGMGGRSKGQADDEPSGSNHEANTKQTASKPEANPDQSAYQTSKQNARDKDKDIGYRILDIGDTPLTPQGEGGSQSFDQFWQAYPKKIGKGAARKAWGKIRPGKALIEKILAAVDAAKRSDQWQRDGGQYIPNPVTWLNQGRWDDDLPEGGTKPPPQRQQFKTVSAQNFSQRDYTREEMNALAIDIDTLEAGDI